MQDQPGQPKQQAERRQGGDRRASFYHIPAELDEQASSLQFRLTSSNEAINRLVQRCTGHDERLKSLEFAKLDLSGRVSKRLDKMESLLLWLILAIVAESGVMTLFWRR